MRAGHGWGERCHVTAAAIRRARTATTTDYAAIAVTKPLRESDPGALGLREHER